ncbi:MAG: helix-turn-helix transcriptional regulator [Galactobacter sp.]
MATTDRSELLISIAYTLMSSELGRTREELHRLVPQYRDEPNQKNFERSFERDKAALRNLGFNLNESRRVQADGPAVIRYRIDPDGYALPSLRFSTTETALLGLAAQVLDGGELARQASRATARLGSAAFGAAAPTAEPVGFTPLVDSAAPHLADLVRYCLSSTPIAFTYRTGDGRTAKREVVPWGLGNRDGHWYLAAGDTKRDAVRMFRLDRFLTEPSQLQSAPDDYVREAYGRTDRFDMASLLSEIGTEAPGRMATLVAAGVSGGSISARATVRRTVGATVELDVEFTDVDSFAAEVAGEGLTVREPEELASAVVRVLETAIAAQSAPAPDYSVRRHGGGRLPTEVKVGRALDLVAYVSAKQDESGGRVALDELCREFDLTQSHLVELLNQLAVCGIPGGMHHELLDVIIDKDGVRIENAEAFAAPMNLSVSEVSAVLIGLEALAAAPAGTLRPEPGTTVAALIARLKALRPGEFDDFERMVAVTLASSDSDPRAAAIGEAIATQRPLEIVYAGPRGLTTRHVEPVQLVDQDNHVYLRAWCRLRDDARVFRLDRIVSATLVPESDPHGTPPEHVAAALALPVVPETAEHEVDLLFTGSWAERAEDYRPLRLGAPKGPLSTVDGIKSVVARCAVAQVSHLVSVVAGSAGQVTVLRPDSVRDAVLAALKSRREALRP